MHAAMLKLKAILDPETAGASTKEYEKELMGSTHADHLLAQEAACETDSLNIDVGK